MQIERAIRVTLVMCLSFLLVATHYVAPTMTSRNSTANQEFILAQIDNIIISNDADFELQGWPGEGTPENPFMISGLKIAGLSPCITIRETTAHFVIEECYLSCENPDAEIGIYLSDLTHGIVRNNTLSGCGIQLEGVSETEVSSNQIETPPLDGISLDDCARIEIKWNIIANSGEDSINAENSANCIFSGNIISDCSTGIALFEVQFSVFTFNSICNVWNYGVEIVSGSNNILYGNLIWRETFGPEPMCEAIDNGLSNQWDDDQGIGNYWDKQSELSQITIEGTGGGRDRYPLQVDFSGWSDWLTIQILPAIYQISLPYGTTADQSKIGWIIWGYPDTPVEIWREMYIMESGHEFTEQLNRNLEGPELLYLDAALLPDNRIGYRVHLPSDADEVAPWYYEVRVIDGLFVTFPGQPENLQSTLIGNQVLLTWSPPEDDGGNPIVEYNVYRGIRPEYMSLRATAPLPAPIDPPWYQDDISNMSSFVFYAVSAVNGLGEGERSRCISNYGEHDRIRIDGDADFLNQGWQGDGTESNPYNISYVFIQSDTISISNVDSYFTISNCWITSSSGRRESPTGIELENVTNGHIESTTVANMDTGIRIFSSQNCTVVNCTAYGSQLGMSLELSENCTIEDVHFDNPFYATNVYLNESRFIDIVGCDFSHPSWSSIGVDAYSSGNCSITNCTFYNVSDAVQVERCHNLLILHSRITHCWTGISIGRSVGVSAVDCEILHPHPDATGIKLQESSICNFRNLTLGNASVDVDGYSYTHWDHNFSNVSLNGLQVGYFFAEENISIDCTNFSQCFISYCTGANLTGSEITSGDYGIRIMNSSSILIQSLARDSLEIWNSSLIEIDNASLGYLRVENSISIELSNLTTSRLYMRRSENCEISNLEISGERANFDVSFCRNIRIVEFKIEIRPSWGGSSVSLGSCFNVTLQNGIYNSTYSNFHVYSSSICKIIDVHLTYPISVTQSNGSSLINCLLSYDKGTNIYLDHSINATIEGCVLRGGGLEITGQERHHWYHRIVQNTLNDRPVVYIANESNLEFMNPRFGQLILVNCQQVYLQNNHFLNTSYGIQLAYCREVQFRDINVEREYQASTFSSYHLFECDQIQITNLLFHCLQSAFRLYSCSNVDLDNCAFGACDAIRFEGDSFFCVVRNSTFKSSGGVRISGGAMFRIIGNTFDQGHGGIRISSGESIQIANNSFSSHQGIYLTGVRESSVSHNSITSSGSIGLELSNCDSNLFLGNRISNSGGSGIFAWSEHNSTFAYNEIRSSNGIGIECHYGSGNRFYANLLAMNSENDAVDNGSDNQWDDGEKLGNCWSLSKSFSPQRILGSAESIDHYPLVVDDSELASPVIAHRFDLNSTVDLENNETEIVWCFWAAPANQTVFVDGTIIREESCTGCGSLGISVSEYGYANYTIRIIDSEGNIEISTIDLGAESRAFQRLVVSIATTINASSIIALVIVWDWKRRTRAHQTVKEGEERERKEIMDALEDLKAS